MSDLTKGQSAVLSAVVDAVKANKGKPVNTAQIKAVLGKAPHSDMLKALVSAEAVVRTGKPAIFALPGSKEKPAPKVKKSSGVPLTRTSVSFPDTEADRKAVLEFCANLRAKAAA